MRNRLIHAYFDIDRDILWRTVTEEIPALLSRLSSSLPADDQGKGIVEQIHSDPEAARTPNPLGSGVRSIIECNTLCEDGSLALIVADTGIGMSEEHIRIAIQPFRHVDSSLAREFEGTGLGVPLTEGLIILQGGRFGSSRA